MLQELASRTDIIMKAREYIGTPFLHQGRLKHKGVDCIGLVVGVGVELGLLTKEQDHISYPRMPDGRLLPLLRQHFLEKPVSYATVGDIMVFSMRNTPCHVGIVTPGGMIHTNMDSNHVVEQPIGQMWAKRRHIAYSFPGVTF